jgi:threonine dehydratase
MSLETDEPPDLDTIRQAHARIGQLIHRTPVMCCRTLDERTGARLYFKCESLQKAGAFKIRGAANAVQCLSDEMAARGVVTHSSGNHAQALALAGRWRGIVVHVVMPETAPAVKQAAVRGYGAKVTLCAPTLQAREETTEEIIRATGATLIHPYNDHRIIAGQGTCALELLEQAPALDLVIAPVGGGGLLSGTAIVAKTLAPGIKVIGAEPARASDAHESLKAGRIIPVQNPDTIADGLRTSLGTRTFPIIRRLVDAIALVEEDEIVTAMRWVYERMKLVIEPSAAVPLAAILAGRLDVKGRRVGVIFSGGNVDVANLPFAGKDQHPPT